ncbi:unnamed protein product [Cunninghamella blakesleeana]
MNITELLLPVNISSSSTTTTTTTTIINTITSNNGNASTIPSTTRKLNDQPKKYPCLWKGCEKSFSRSADVTRHYRIHTNDRRFLCEVCGKRFIQRSALTVHLRTHSGEKPHQCEYPNCQKQFSDSSALARHRRIHPGNLTPYKCQICHQGYTKKNQLMKHLGQHDLSSSSFNYNKKKKKTNDHLFVLPYPSSSSSIHTSSIYSLSFTI